MPNTLPDKHCNLPFARRIMLLNELQLAPTGYAPDTLADMHVNKHRCHIARLYSGLEPSCAPRLLPTLQHTSIYKAQRFSDHAPLIMDYAFSL